MEKLFSLTLPGDGAENTIEAPDGIPDGGNLFSIISWVVNALTIVGVIAALGFLMWGGIKWITSGGDKEKLESARRTVIYAIIGLIVIILSVVIIGFIDGILGTNYIG